MGWWHSLFGDDDDDTERTRYEGAIAGGSTVLRVTVPENLTDRAAEILNRNGAEDVDKLSSQEATRTDFARTGTSERQAEGGPIQVVEEELQVGKRSVRRGGVRIYSHVVSQPVEQNVNLHEEHVTVERRQVNREISPEEVNRLRDQTIEVTETAEEPVVAKRARVREEVVVGKEGTNRTETIRDNVRRTEVEVEQLTPETANVGETTRGTATASAGTTTGSTTGTGRRPTGLSPNEPSPSVQSGFGSTAGQGTLAGESTAGWAGDRDITTGYRKHFESMYEPGGDFEAMRPAYEYGSRYANDERYRGRQWSDVESDLRSGYERDNPGSTWDNVKAAVRHGWERVTGQR